MHIVCIFDDYSGQRQNNARLSTPRIFIELSSNDARLTRCVALLRFLLQPFYKYLAQTLESKIRKEDARFPFVSASPLLRRINWTHDKSVTSIRSPINTKRLPERPRHIIDIDYLRRLLPCRSPSELYCLLKVRFPGEHEREDATDAP